MKVAIILSSIVLALCVFAITQSKLKATSTIEERTGGSWTIFSASVNVGASRVPWVFLYNKKTGVVYRYFRNDESEGFFQLHPRGS